MSRLKLKLDFQVEFILNEEEAKALDALAGYGTDEFLKSFYKNMGTAYLQPHESGIRSMFEKIKALQSQISEIDRLKKEISKIKCT